jgi:hypothetical protein
MTELMHAREAYEQSTKTQLRHTSVLANSQWQIVCRAIKDAVDTGEVSVDVSGTPYDCVKSRLHDLGYRIEQYTTHFSVDWWWNVVNSRERKGAQ